MFVSEAWMPPSVVASAVLQLAQDQWRAPQIDPQQRGSPGPDIPGELGKAVPAPCDNAAPAPSVPVDACGPPHDPSVVGLLEKVAELRQCMSARRSLGGLLTNKAAKRAGSKFHKRWDSRRRKRKRGSDVSSGTSRDSDKSSAFDLVPSSDRNRFQVTSEREPSSGLQQIKKFLAQRV